MIDGDLLSILERIASSLERLADKFAPVEKEREKRPAQLSKAIYDREERKREALRKAFREEEPKPPR